MWVIVEFVQKSDMENEVAEIYGPFQKESSAVDKCKKWNDLGKIIGGVVHYEVYELMEVE